MKLIQVNFQIMWSIDLSKVKAKQVKISMKGCERFESGSVDAMVCSGDVILLFILKRILVILFFQMCMIVRKGELIFDDVPQAVVKITVIFKISFKIYKKNNSNVFFN